MRQQTPLDYQVPRPQRPSRLWIIVRLLVAAPLGWMGIAFILTASPAGRGPLATVILFSIGVTLTAFAVAALILPAYRRRE